MRFRKFIFSNNFFYRAARHLTFWLARLLFMLLYNTPLGYDFQLGILQNLTLRFKESFTSILFEIPYCYIVIYFFRPQFLSKKKYRTFIISVIILTIADIFLRLFYPFNENNHFSLEQAVLIIRAISQDLMLIYSPVICGLFLTIKTFKSWYLKQQENQILIKANADAEKILLKAQIHPHFLFNTLNNIYSFTLIKSSKAGELVASLSEIMKYMVNDCNVDMIALNKEVKNAAALY